MTPNRLAAIAFRWSISAVFTLCVFAPKAHGQQTSATGTPQPVAGVTVDVKMVDTVDSSSDPAGKQYRAGLIRPVDIGNGVIVAQGSVVTLTLTRSTSGWGVQLSCLVINGQLVPVTSNAGSVIGAAARSDVANAAKAASSVHGVFGRKPNPIPVVAAVATGERVILPPGTSLSFVLNASPAANRPASANPFQANATALPANQPGRSYYCTFNDTVQRPNMTRYFSGVFQADASQIEVSKAWTNYIRQTYLPGDNRDSGSCQIGTEDQQQRVETALRQTWQVMATGSERAGMNIPKNTVVDVSWKFAPAASAAAAPSSASAAPAAPPATPRGQPSATSMTGVYIGGYTCNGGPSKLKVSLIGAPDDTLAGFFTIDLPYDGPRFTYKLTGRYAWGTHQFLLTSVPWGLEPPAEYTMERLTGKYYPGSDLLRGYVTSRFCSDFWGKRDESESPESIAAAMRTPPAPSPSQPQPAERSAAEIKAALPPPAPPNGLVRKSRAYWDDYRYDLTRQVFDGGFGRDIDSDKDFRLLFNTYVEMYSKHCRAYLPAQHVTIGVTQVIEKTDRNGNTTSQQQGQTAMVEVDSRFAPPYREFGQAVMTPGETLAGALAISSGRVSASNYFGSSVEIDKFFAKESCNSAAMHQINENLLRAATKERSLQQAGATIPGAAAETDKSLPPGRFARFVDGCNAFYRDPANSRHRPANAWCKCLSEQYQTLMSRDEESLYGNDFQRLFLWEIAQPKSTDPAWQRLHPACDRCAQ
jgi:hypothetical protein